MARPMRIVQPAPPYRNGIYPHRSFGPRRRTIYVTREELLLLSAVVFGLLAALVALAVALIGMVWVILAVGRAVEGG